MFIRVLYIQPVVGDGISEPSADRQRFQDWMYAFIFGSLGCKSCSRNHDEAMEELPAKIFRGMGPLKKGNHPLRFKGYTKPLDPNTMKNEGFKPPIYG